MLAPKKYQVIIIEPSEITVEGIKQFLEKHSSFRLKACFTNWQLFENQCFRKDDFQIAIINPAILQFHSSFNVRDLFVNYPCIYIVALQTQYISESILSCFDGIINIYDEGLLLPNKLLRIIENADNCGTERGLKIRLSKREIEVLIHLVGGLGNKEIASEMCLSTHTVMSYRKSLIRKTAIKTVSGLTLYALANNLISIDHLSTILPRKKGIKI